MEGHSHDAVGQVKGLLYAVTVVNVDVNVENSGVVSKKHAGLKKKHTLGKTECVSVLLQQLQYADDYVIYVTKARCLQTQTQFMV